MTPASPPDTAALRLKTTHRPLWRGPAALQLGTDPARALVLTGVTGAAGRALHALAEGSCAPADEGLIHLLRAGGALEHQPAQEPQPPGRLAPERAQLGLRHPDPGSAEAILIGRAAVRVLVVGGGRVGATVAHLLAASGLGRVGVQDAAPVREADACPGGVSVADVGLRRGAAATAVAVRTCGPVLDAGPPDVVVLCPDGLAPPDPALWWPLLESGSALLCASIRETTGVVGPFTTPYGRCCPGCLSLHRSDRDPAWPLVERQLADPRRAPAGTPAATTVLAVTATAAEQVLGWVDARTMGTSARPDAVGCTLELPTPGWRWHRRRWGAHPGCRCLDLQPPGG